MNEPQDFSARAVHTSGKNHYREDRAPNDPSLWPEEWKTTFYKEYTRFPIKDLPDIIADDQLKRLIALRSSKRIFQSRGLSMQSLAVLLKYGCGEFSHSELPVKHRAYPSGGARYPTEVYVVLRRSVESDLSPGIYHYNVKKHALEFMWREEDAPHDMKPLFLDEWAADASALFVLTSVFWRTQNKYRDRGYRYACIETGAILQNMYLLCETLGLSCTALGGTNDDVIEQMLALDIDTESLMISMVIG